MDRIDRQILTLLQENSKISNQELAEKVALSPSPCLRRVKQLEEDGYIDRYVALLNPKKVGLELAVLVSVELNSHEPAVMTDFETAIKNVPEVLQCYLVAGQTHEYILKVVTPSLEGYQELLLKKLIQIDGVKNVNSSFIMRRIIDDSPLPLGHLS